MARRVLGGATEKWAEGVVVALFGLLLLVNLALPGGIGVENEKQLATAANVGRNYEETIARTTRAEEQDRESGEGAGQGQGFPGSICTR